MSLAALVARGRLVLEIRRGAWALERAPDRELVAAALASRDRQATLGRERVERFVDDVLAESERCSARERGLA